MTDPDKAKKEIEQLLRANRKIQAVGYAKIAFGVSWKEANQLVDAVAREHGIEVSLIPQKAGCVSNALKITGWFFMVGAMMVLGVAAITYYMTNQSIEDSELVMGKVVEMTPYNAYDPGEGSYAPVVAYTWQGEEREYKSSFFNKPPAYVVGQEVELFVNRENPEEVTINSFADRWLVVTIMGTVGGLFLILAIGLFVFARKLR